MSESMKSSLERLESAIGRLEAVSKSLAGSLALASSLSPYNEAAWKDAQEAADKYIARRKAEIMGAGRHLEPAE